MMKNISEIERRKLIIQCVELSLEKDPDNKLRSLEVAINSYKDLSYIDGEINLGEKESIRYWHHRIYTRRRTKPANQYKDIRG